MVDESGNQGLGEAALNPFAEDVTTASLGALMREIAPGLAAGRLPVWADLAAEGEPGRAAMASVDGALASLRAARAATSSATAGARASAATSGGSVAVGAVIAFGGPDAGADAAEQAVRLGFETLKIRAGFERTTDQLIDRVRAIRAAVGQGPRLRIDVAGAWDLDTAAERMQALESFRIEFVEQPLPAWDTIRHATLRERTRVPVALDESIDSEGAARAALADGAADVIVVKPARVGGQAATLRIAEAAAARGVAVVTGTYFESGVGIAAVLRVAAALGALTRPGATERAHGAATAGVLVHDLLVTPLPINKGRMAVPDSLALDEDEVARYAIERFDAVGRNG